MRRPKPSFRELSAAFAAFLLLTVAGSAAAAPAAPAAPQAGYLFSDSHFHLTNYIQEGITAKDLLKIMGNQVERSTLFGIPLQQQWSYRVDGDNAPKYYLDTDAPLYYYSFTDAYIAMQYRSLTKDEQARLDPMITGFNPTDMYAADHIRRVLQTFPGVFTGIGEFTIHKEFVAAKVAGGVASLTDPALDRVFDFAAEAGLISILHSDITKPFPKAGVANYLSDIKALFKRHPGATIIWAHIGLGRIVQPIGDQVAAIDQILKDPAFRHVYFDISWDEVAKYAVASDASIQRVAEVLNKYPDRFLFGTDTVAPRDPKPYLGVYHMWDPVWAKLTPEAREKVTKGNYRRLFDAARVKVRAWEKAHVK
jgi:predicted TIM-barrel fold metal-dependent hydrolase